MQVSGGGEVRPDVVGEGAAGCDIRDLQLRPPMPGQGQKTTVDAQDANEIVARAKIYKYMIGVSSRSCKFRFDHIKVYPQRCVGMISD